MKTVLRRELLSEDRADAARGVDLQLGSIKGGPNGADQGSGSRYWRGFIHGWLRGVDEGGRIFQRGRLGFCPTVGLTAGLAEHLHGAMLSARELLIKIDLPGELRLQAVAQLPDLVLQRRQQGMIWRCRRRCRDRWWLAGRGERMRGQHGVQPGGGCHGLHRRVGLGELVETQLGHGCRMCFEPRPRPGRFIGLREPAQQCAGIHRHPRGEERGGGLEEGLEASPLVIQRDHQGLSIAQDLTDPAAARSLGAVLHKGTHAVLPGGLDHAAKIQRAVCLGEDRVGAGVWIWIVSSARGAGVNTDSLVDRHSPAMQRDPGLTHLVQLRDVHRQIVAQPQAAISADLFADPVAPRGVAGHDAVGVGVDHREVDARALSHQRLHLGHGSQHRPGGPVDGRSPGSTYSVHLLAELLGEDTAGGTLSHHRVQVGPGSAGEQGVALP